MSKNLAILASVVAFFGCLLSGFIFGFLLFALYQLIFVRGEGTPGEGILFLILFGPIGLIGGLIAGIILSPKVMSKLARQ